MTNRIKFWSVRAIVVLVLSFLAYTGGTLLERATATVEFEYCENDVCNGVGGLGWCSNKSGSKTGCDRTGWGCITYYCEMN